jgi:hypothetical protein
MPLGHEQCPVRALLAAFGSLGTWTSVSILAQGTRMLLSGSRIVTSSIPWVCLLLYHLWMIGVVRSYVILVSFRTVDR